MVELEEYNLSAPAQRLCKTPLEYGAKKTTKKTVGNAVKSDLIAMHNKVSKQFPNDFQSPLLDFLDSLVTVLDNNGCMDEPKPPKLPKPSKGPKPEEPAEVPSAPKITKEKAPPRSSVAPPPVPVIETPKRSVYPTTKSTGKPTVKKIDPESEGLKALAATAKAKEEGQEVPKPEMTPIKKNVEAVELPISKEGAKILRAKVEEVLGVKLPGTGVTDDEYNKIVTFGGLSDSDISSLKASTFLEDFKAATMASGKFDAQKGSDFIRKRLPFGNAGYAPADAIRKFYINRALGLKIGEKWEYRNLKQLSGAINEGIQFEEELEEVPKSKVPKKEEIKVAKIVRKASGRAERKKEAEESADREILVKTGVPVQKAVPEKKPEVVKTASPLSLERKTVTLPEEGDVLYKESPKAAKTSGKSKTHVASVFLSEKDETKKALKPTKWNKVHINRYAQLRKAAKGGPFTEEAIDLIKEVYPEFKLTLDDVGEVDFGSAEAFLLKEILANTGLYAEVLYDLFTKSREAIPLESFTDFRDQIKADSLLRTYLETGKHPIYGKVVYGEKTAAQMGMPTPLEVRYLLSQELTEAGIGKSGFTSPQNLRDVSIILSRYGLGPAFTTVPVSYKGDQLEVKWDPDVFNTFWEAVIEIKEDDQYQTIFKAIQALREADLKTQGIEDREQVALKDPSLIKGLYMSYGKLPQSSVTEIERYGSVEMLSGKEGEVAGEGGPEFKQMMDHSKRKTLMGEYGREFIEEPIYKRNLVYEVPQADFSRLGYIPVNYYEGKYGSVLNGIAPEVVDQLLRKSVWLGIAAWKPSYEAGVNERRTLSIIDDLAWRSLYKHEDAELKVRLEDRFKGFSSDFNCAFGAADLPALLQSDFLIRALFDAAVRKQALSLVTSKRNIDTKIAAMEIEKSLANINFLNIFKDLKPGQKVGVDALDELISKNISGVAAKNKLKEDPKWFVETLLANGVIKKEVSGEEMFYEVKETSPARLRNFKPSGKNRIILSLNYALGQLKGEDKEYISNNRTIVENTSLADNETLDKVIEVLRDSKNLQDGMPLDDLMTKAETTKKKEFNMVIDLLRKAGSVRTVHGRVFWTGASKEQTDMRSIKGIYEEKLREVTSYYFNEDGNVATTGEGSYLLGNPITNLLNAPPREEGSSKYKYNVLKYMNMAGDALNATKDQLHLQRCLFLPLDPTGEITFIKTGNPLGPLGKDPLAIPKRPRKKGAVLEEEEEEVSSGQTFADIATVKGGGWFELDNVSKQFDEVKRTPFEQKKMEKLFPRNSVLIDRHKKKVAKTVFGNLADIKTTGSKTSFSKP